MEIDSPTVHSQYSQLDLDELIRLAHQAQRPLIKKQLEKWVEEIRTSIQNKPPIVEQLPKQVRSIVCYLYFLVFSTVICPILIFFEGIITT